MAKTYKAGRNDPCPCGSGKKFKKCHEPQQQQRSRFTIFMLIIVAGAMVSALAFGLRSQGEGSSVPGAGKVWSPEHGHWH